IIYSFFGWCLEVIYQAVELGKFVNRGFLNGPYCPIYGFGMIIVTDTLEPLKDNIIVLYVGSVILTTALELVTGFVLEKIFHQNWWDYSEERFNLKGYICLKFSLLWGIACLIAVRLIHPFVVKFVDYIPEAFGLILICIIMTGFVSDMIITVFAVIHIKNRLKLLDSISAEMRKISDYTGEKLYNSVENSKKRREKYEELREKYKKTGKRKLVDRRIENAFPKLKINTDKSLREQFEELKQVIGEKKNKK
ncbi:MAG: putative ABC transporter permease, partial [Ruminococcus sp.]|nr:putative ABC transporter permease [Ruminococcus sp.]